MAEQHSWSTSEVELPDTMDTKFVAPFEKAREVNAELAYNFSLTDEEAHQKLGELNAIWPVTDAPIRVWGKLNTMVLDFVRLDTESAFDDPKAAGSVRIGPVFENTRQPKECEYMVNGIWFGSLGFVLGKEKVIVDDEEVGTRHIVQLAFKRLVYLAEPTGDTVRPCETTSFAKVDDIDLFYPTVTNDFMRSRSMDFFPGLASKLVKQETSHRTPAERIMALRKTRAARPGFVEDVDIQLLESYATLALGIRDELAPFAVHLREDTELYETADPETISSTLQEMTKFVVLNGVRIRPKTRIIELPEGKRLLTESDQLELRLGVTFLGSDAASDTQEYELRLSDIENIKSIRQAIDPGELI